MFEFYHRGEYIFNIYVGVHCTLNHTTATKARDGEEEALAAATPTPPDGEAPRVFAFTSTQ